MNFKEYEAMVKEVRLPSADFNYALLGLSGEVGELHSMFAKAIRDDIQLDQKACIKELGDVLWFVAALASDLGTSLEEVALKNKEKLESRKFRNVIMGNGDNR